MNIQRLPAGHPLPMSLLLAADPDEARVLAYCQTGQVWVMGEAPIAGVVVFQALPEKEPTAEIKNIAIQPGLQGQGLGQQLLSFIKEEAQRQGILRLLVATGNSSIGQLAFYQKAGFEMLRIDRHYFTRNYPFPIVENGIPCRHRVVLEHLLD
ncbi:MAG: GNAT family N-acetyltransferase [Phaeodactylibacter sp.]|uniref:GNAT family N-acetyltransferase n=1 Tax=Phaeodactylibacter sp. TaxID=1940289 RepID=UPI0032EEF628